MQAKDVLFVLFLRLPAILSVLCMTVARLIVRGRGESRGASRDELPLCLTGAACVRGSTRLYSAYLRRLAFAEFCMCGKQLGGRMQRPVV